MTAKKKDWKNFYKLHSFHCAKH